MLHEKPGSSHRRKFLKGIAVGGAAFVSKGLWGPPLAVGQTPPNCPPAPVNGTPFRRGQDTRPIVQRKSVSALTASQISQLRLAFAKLRALPSTDNRAWVIQVDMHALYCQACNHDLIQSVHGSWNFFPWHRAFIYYFERILGSLVGDINNFRLPYWDWENYRSMPSAYLSPANSTNSLYDVNRYSVIAKGGVLPANDGTTARIALLDGITDFATFGGTAKAGGTCESNPHDPIHDDIGLHTSPWHDMGHLGFAARDPIFFAHHGNLDKVWSYWNAFAGGSNLPSEAYQNPTDPAFLSERWNFYDENQRAVSISAADVLVHPTNLRYTYPSPPATAKSSAFKEPLTAAVSSSAAARRAPVVSTHAARLVYSRNGLRPGPSLDVTHSVKTSVLQGVGQQSSVIIVLRGVTVPENATGVFDIMSAQGSRMKHLGTLAVVGDAMRMSPLPRTVVLDATDAADDLLDTSNPARITLVPRQGNGSFELKPQDIELRVVSRR
ncbi:MAG: tyrosinase family protein [Bryobacteraceae bacterium]